MNPVFYYRNYSASVHLFACMHLIQTSDAADYCFESTVIIPAYQIYAGGSPYIYLYHRSCIMFRAVFSASARGCIYISAKCSDISKQTPGWGFIFAVFVRYEPLFNSTHEVFYKQGHQIWSLYKYISKWLHLRSAPEANLDAFRNYRLHQMQMRVWTIK